MLVSKVARRYAAALFQLAEEKKQLDKVLTDVSLIQNTIVGSRELLLFLRNKIVKEQKKKEVLEAIFGKKITPLTESFIQFLVDKKREDQLLGATSAFKAAYNKKMGILEVEAHFVQEPDKNQMTELQRKLEKLTGQKIVLHTKKDESLIGGLLVKIEDTVIDGSVKNKLHRLESLFLGNA